MSDPLLTQRVDAIRRLARRGATPALAKIIAKSRAEDVAAVMDRLSAHDQRLVFQQIKSEEVAADVLTHLGPEEFKGLIGDLPLERVSTLFAEMEVDDQTDLLELLPEEQRDAVLERIKGEEREQVEELLGYAPDTAGGIMSPLAFRLQAEATCRDAIASVQAASDHELIYYAYVENEEKQLVGVISLRNLLTHPPSTRLHEIMTADVITVRPEMDQEEVARIAGRYDLLAVPVVDDQRHLLGIVTVDDVIDVIREEAAEDMLLMAGVSEGATEASRMSRWEAVTRRLPWLLVTMGGGFLISEIIKHFQPVLSTELMLAGFIPIVTGMEGNVGIQSATVTVRNLALGRLDGNIGRTVTGEAVNGISLGAIFGVCIGSYCYLRYGDSRLAGSVAIAILCGMTAATLSGTLVPLTLRRFGIDPAIATGPFVTTAMDILGLTIYLSIATLLLSVG